MLIFTNRLLDTNLSDERMLTLSYDPFSASLNALQIVDDGKKTASWEVGSYKDKVNDQDALTVLISHFQGGQPVLVYLHGNNTTPALCLTRCKALEDQFGVAVIGYSWTSEGYQPDGTDLSGINKGKLATDNDENSLAAVSKNNLQEGWIQRKARRYAQAKVNAQHSTASLARFLRLVASARLATMTQPFSVAVHSLGCHFLHYAIEQEGASESFAVAHNVALIAGCTGAAKHAHWVEKLNPVKRVYIMYTKADSVLAGATEIDRDVKLGTNPGSELLISPKCRYVDFEGAKGMIFGAHRYFVADPDKKLSKHAEKLFRRLVSSEIDFSSDESPKVVYPVNCKADGSVCYMGGGAGSSEAG